jgi:hypothetical protein
VVLAPFGVLWFRVTGRTPTGTYRLMRRIHTAAPRLVDPRRRPAYPGELTAAEGAVGCLSVSDLLEVREQLDRDGLAVLQGRLPTETVAALTELAARASCTLVGSGRPGRTGRFDPEHPRATRYEVPEARLLADPTVQRLVVDPVFRRLGAAYLRAEPVNDLVSMWWTAPHAGDDLSVAAQLFHSDRDRLSFVKAFAYLTDVGPDQGPHVYVLGSHHDRPLTLRADRRYSDEEVAAHYPAESHLAVEGPAGTVFLADTRGLHRGRPPRSGHRLVFQLEYATGLLGAPYESFPERRLRDDVRAEARAHRTTYQRLLRG